MDDLTNSALKIKRGLPAQKIGHGMANLDPNRKAMQHRDK